jgi:hypothetical protein
MEQIVNDRLLSDVIDCVGSLLVCEVFQVSDFDGWEWRQFIE